VFLATSDELPGLVAEGRTVAEALEIARDVARKLIEARCDREGAPHHMGRLAGFRYREVARKLKALVSILTARRRAVTRSGSAELQMRDLMP